jgi:hypothetical protein
MFGRREGKKLQKQMKTEKSLIKIKKNSKEPK